MRRRTGPLAAALLAALAAAAPAAARVYRCPAVRGMECHRITVPLDRTGAVPGSLGLRFAATPENGRTRALVALTGGPGQPGVLFGPDYRRSFAPLLRKYRLVVVDQRGTGGSNALNCPELQGFDALTQLYPEDVAGCARRLGPQRASYASIESAHDLEAIRQNLGVDKLAIYGISYGTWVAQQYAREFPAHVERLVLDSPVADNVDPFDLQTPEALPRVLREYCARRACRGLPVAPMADLTAVVRRIQRRGPLKGSIVNRRGGREQVTLGEAELLSVLVAGDLNPPMRARIPGALAAARAGDLAPLLRMKRDAAGAADDLKSFSDALFITTTCLDSLLPYSLADDGATRLAKAEGAVAAIPLERIAPFDRATMNVSSVSDICIQWPNGSFRAESTRPLPRVPTLILSGTVDLRTPLENARAVAAQVPGAKLVTMQGNGHDVLDFDTSGCVLTAMRRFFANRAVGRPCAKETTAPLLAAVPPRSLSEVRGVPGVPGLRGRLLRATVQTMLDAKTSDDESFDAGFSDETAGGLRGGKFTILPTGDGDALILDRVVYVPGVVVDGVMLSTPEDVSGSVRVAGPGGMRGRLTVGRRAVRGTIGGRRVAASRGVLSLTARPVTARPARVVASRLRLP